MNWPSRLILSRHEVLIATSVLVVVLVAGVSVLLRHVLSEAGVATSWSCHDILVLAAVVATAWCCRDFHSAQLLSRHPNVVATSSLCNCCRDIMMLSRLLQMQG